MKGAILAVALSGLFGATAFGAFPLNMSSTGSRDGTATVEIDSPFTELPGSGYLPVRVRIKNLSGQTHYYRIESTGQTSYGQRGTREDRRDVEVDAGQTEIFEVLVPMPTQLAGRTWCRLEVKVSGGPGGIWTAARSPRMPAGRGGPNATVGFGPGLPNPATHLKGAVPGDIYALEVDPGLLPEDWRGYLGLDALWLSTADISQVPAAALRPLAQWVAQGGAIVLVGDPAEIGNAPLGFAEERWQVGRYGLGRLHRLVGDSSGPDGMKDTLSSLRARVIVSEHRSRARDFAVQGSVQASIAPVEIHRAWIIAFLLGLVVLIGPINLFVFAPKRHRMRLLWSTPLLSVGVSIVLMAAIVLQDGVGLEGNVAQLVLQMSDAHAEHVFQAQSGRTGLVLSGGFELDPGVHFELLPIGKPQDDMEGRDLQRDGRSASGDWFLTRSRQAHLLQSVRATRASVVHMNPGDSGPPRLRSNQNVSLDTIYYQDDAGQTWRGSELLPGETLQLVPATAQETEAFLAEAASRLPGHLKSAALAAFPQQGWLMASTSGQFSPLATLKGGTWRSEPTLVLSKVQSEGTHEYTKP